MAPAHVQYRVSDSAASCMFNSSPSFLSESSSDLDSQSSGSTFFPEKSTTLGSLIGIRANSQTGHRLMVHELMEEDLMRSRSSASSGTAMINIGHGCKPGRTSRQTSSSSWISRGSSSNNSRNRVPSYSCSTFSTLLGCNGDISNVVEDDIDHQSVWSFMTPLQIVARNILDNTDRRRPNHIITETISLSSSSCRSAASSRELNYISENVHNRAGDQSSELSIQCKSFDNILHQSFNGDAEEHTEPLISAQSRVISADYGSNCTSGMQLDQDLHSDLHQSFNGDAEEHKEPLISTQNRAISANYGVNYGAEMQLEQDLHSDVDMDVISTESCCNVNNFAKCRTGDGLMNLVIQQTSGWNVFHSRPYYPFKPA